MAEMSPEEFRKGLVAMLTAEAQQTALVAANPDLAKKAVRQGKVDWTHVDVGVEHAGKKITLPADPVHMPLEEGVKALQRKIEDQKTVVQVHEVIDAFPLDGAVAFVRALQQMYGWANSVPTPGFWGPKPPRMITVDVGPGPDEKIQVPWGGFQIPGVENPIYTDTMGSKRGEVLVIHGQVKKKDVTVLKEIAALTREIVKAHSIYRGQAIRLRQSEEGTSAVDMSNPPEFIDLSAAKLEELVLPREVENLIQTNIWTLVEKTELCKSAKIPLKRGVLLAGKYGTGKTLASLMTAQKCVQHNWTFISLDRVHGLRQTLEFARRYEPCIIFAEDIDRAAADRNENTNDLLNVMDGVLSKTSQVMVVMTTNHVERINQAMLRPGRLDAVIPVTPPDAEAVQRLLRIYGRKLLRRQEKLERIGNELAGTIPAVIREVVERSKLAAVNNNNEYVTEDDLLAVAFGMRHHMALLAEPTVKRSAEEELGHALAELVGKRVGEMLAKSTSLTLEVVDQIANTVGADNAGDRVHHIEGGNTFKEAIRDHLAKTNGVATAAS